MPTFCNFLWQREIYLMKKFFELFSTLKHVRKVEGERREEQLKLLKSHAILLWRWNWDRIREKEMVDLDRDFLEYTNLLIPQKDTMLTVNFDHLSLIYTFNNIHTLLIEIDQSIQIFVCSGICVEANIFKPSIVRHSIIYLSLASQWIYDLRKALKTVRNIKFRSRTWG